MAITNENFDQLKIDKLKYFLDDMAQKGAARPYEIFVDTLKVVPKTEDPVHFDSHEYYINEDTEKIRILIYNSNQSPRNDQYCFYLKPLKQNNASLNGPEDLGSLIQQKLNERDREHELQRTREELDETKKQLGEAENYIEGLEEKLRQAGDEKYKFKNIDLLDLGAAMLGKLAEKHAGSLAQLGLGGIAGADSTGLPAPEGEASFQKKSSAPPLTETQLQYLGFLQQLESVFKPDDLSVIMEILHRFMVDPKDLQAVVTLLHIQS